MIRITADIDRVDMIFSLRQIRIALLQWNLNPISIELRESSGKRGHHIIICCENPLNNETIFKIRQLLGDDKRRIDRDLKRKQPKQYLFKEKIKLR